MEATVSYVLSAVVGWVLLVTGGLKALDSGRFVMHVRRYGLFPPAWVQTAALAFIASECALGAALVLNLSPSLLPLAAVVLAGFIALTAWGMASGRVEDCGCYGGLVMLTPARSLALDGVYLGTVVVAWLLAPDGPPVWAAAWEMSVVGVVAVAALVAAVQSRQTPLLNLALLGVGRPWRRHWLKRYTRDVTRGSHFVVFLSRECPYCKRWVPLLNVVEVQPDLPSVVAVMSLEGDELQGFLNEHLITFPVTHMPQSLLALMASAYPTAALVENGRITGKWVGEMPKEYLDRVREFLATIAAPVRQPRGGFAG